MGDILMFFEQGYNLYLEAVQAKKVYKLKKTQCAPWGELELKVRISTLKISQHIKYYLFIIRNLKW